jgi:hypothetical protein
MSSDHYAEFNSVLCHNVECLLFHKVIVVLLIIIILNDIFLNAVLSLKEVKSKSKDMQHNYKNRMTLA